MINNSQNVFDFLVNNEGEVLLLLGERDGEPKNSYVELSEKDNSALLYRNDNDELLLKDIPDNIFEDLSAIETLLVCELSNVSNDEETEIIHAYEIDVK